MKKILLIEDNLDMRENTAEMLDLANYVVVTAENGKIGVEKAKQEKPDLIICDIMMPDLDGYGVLHMISKDPEIAGTPFIFLTAKAEKSDMRKGMNLGADDYMVKPFDKVELLNAIETRLKRNEYFKKNYSRDLSGLVQFVDAASKFSLPSNVSTNYKVRSFQLKESLYHEGDEPNFVFFVNKGKVKSWRMSADGKELITGVYSKGDFFGFNSILEGSNYQDSATALEDTEVAFIPKNDFLSLVYSKQEVSARFIKMLVNNINEKEEQLLSLAYNSVRGRVADALMKLQKKFQPSTNLSFSREDLANMVGTSTETLIRTLSDFKHEKMIEIDGRDVKILNVPGLERIRKFS
ncbi:MAG TPA: response regulator [Bacteroidia bacterium]|jgi:DNA-binding response OmpR family regulator|nr:response regulator [Bacteroidia bacterium]